MCLAELHYFYCKRVCLWHRQALDSRIACPCKLYRNGRFDTSFTLFIRNEDLTRKRDCFRRSQALDSLVHVLVSFIEMDDITCEVLSSLSKWTLSLAKSLALDTVRLWTVVYHVLVSFVEMDEFTCKESCFRRSQATRSPRACSCKPCRIG